MERIKINRDIHPFVFGRCADNAICKPFGLTPRKVYHFRKKMGIDSKDGMTTRECRKVIEELCKKYNVSYTYGLVQSPFDSFVDNIRKDSSYLIIQENHLTFLSGGVAFDTFLYSLSFHNVMSDVINSFNTKNRRKKLKFPRVYSVYIFHNLKNNV